MFNVNELSVFGEICDIHAVFDHYWHLHWQIF